MNKNKVLIIIFLITFIILFSDNSFANTADTGIVAKIVGKFKSESDKWFNIAKKTALNLFYWVAVLEVAFIGIRASISVADIKETISQFVMMILASGFFLAVINNYQEWSSSLINGLKQLAGEMTSTQNSSDNPFVVGLQLVKTINQQVETLYWTDFGLILALYIAAFIVIICFSLITAKIIVIKCESMIAMVAALILIPLGACSFFREYAVNAVRYIFSVAFKLFTMQLVIGVGFSFINELKVAEATMSNIAVILGFVVVLLAVSLSIPDTVAGIINGSHVGSGAGLMASVALTASVAGNAISTGAKASSAGMAINNATKIAKAEGSSGFASVAMGAGKAMMNARHQSQMRKTSMGGELKDRLASIRESK